MRRWEKHLRLRHIWALEEAVRAFFSLVADHELRADVLAAVHTEAVSVFRAQEESVELSRWDSSEGKRHVATLSEAHIPEAKRMAFLRELKHVHAHERDVCPALIPFDYSPSSPESTFLQGFLDRKSTV